MLAATQETRAQKLISTNPARNYEVLGDIIVSSADDVTATVAAARKAQPLWQEIGLEKRIEHLQKLADVFKANRSELIKRPMQEAGMPLYLAENLAKGAEETFAWYLENAPSALSPVTLYEDAQEINEVIYDPYGVVACIVAWNFLYPNFIKSAVQALLGGNTVVMKYSEETPLFSQYLEGLIQQAGLPEGVVNFVYGDGIVGAELANASIDFIHFTGSSATGQKLYEIAAKKFIPIVNELGGSSPGIVFKNSNLDEIIQDISEKRFLNTGQFCNGLKRLIVDESIFDEVVEKLSAHASSKVLGDPFDESTDLGPLVAKRQVVKLEEQLTDALEKGAKLVCGGKRPPALEGAYFQPTLLTNITREMKVWHEEVFGPLLPIVRFKTYEEALELAHDTSYGLNAYVYTNDKAIEKRVFKDLKVGTVCTFGAHTHRPQNPFGGYKKSGLGRTGGLKGFYEVTQTKTIGRSK